MTSMTSIFRRLSTTVSGWSNAYFGQTRSRSRLNVIAGYDQSNDLYEACLPALFLRPETRSLLVAFVRPS